MESLNNVNTSSNIDIITGLPNNNALDIDSNEIVERIKIGFTGEEKVIYTVMMCDVNGLKVLNDEYGHIAGNYGLRKIADIIKESIRMQTEDIDRKDLAYYTSGIAYRYGGDEFVIILQNCDEKLAELVKLRIIKRIEKEKIEHGFGLSLAIGITDTTIIPPVNIGNNAQYLESLLSDADRKMYEEKTKMKRNMPEEEQLKTIISILARGFNSIGLDILNDDDYETFIQKCNKAREELKGYRK